MSDAVKMMRLDILSMKVYLKSYLIVIIYPIFFSWWSPSMLALICCFMFAVVAGSVFSVQEKNRLDRLYGIFHLSKRSIVGGRYLYVCLNLLAAYVTTIPVYLLITTVTNNRPDTSELIFGYGLGFLFFWLLVGVQLPLFFRMGYTKARFWSYFPFLLIALIPVLIHFFPLLGQAAPARGIVAILESAQYNPWPFVAACVCFGLVLALASALCSLLLYRHQG